MLEEARVFGSNDRIFHDLGDVLDAHERSPFLAKFADQHAVSGEDAKRNPGLVVEQRIKRGQPVVDQQRGKRSGERDGRRERERGDGKHEQKPPDAEALAGGCSHGRGSGRSGSAGHQEPTRQARRIAAEGRKL